MSEFHLIVATPDGEVFNGNAISLLSHTSDGDVEILKGHVDYIASLGTGRTRIRTKDGDRVASTSGGFVTVCGDTVTLVATTFEYKDDIDLDRAKAAKEKAYALLCSAKDGKAIALAKAKLARALNRIKVKEGL